MTNPTTITARALYRAAKILDNEALQDGLVFVDLWRRIELAEPSLFDDWNEAGAERDILEQVLADVSKLVKAGWLYRGHRRWQLTGLGHEALRSRPDPVDFYAEAGRRHYAWKKGRAGFEAAEALLEKLPDRTMWVAVDDLAMEYDLEPEALAGFLRGARHEGWYLALSAEGEAGAGLPLLSHERDEWRTFLDHEGLFDAAGSSQDTVRAYIEQRLPPEVLTGLTLGDTRGGSPTEPELPRQLWIIRGTDRTTNEPLVRGPWRQQNVITLPLDRLPTLPAGAGRERIRALVDEANPTTAPDRRDRISDELYGFLSRMRERDIVLCTDRSDTYIGEVRGPVRFRTDDSGMVIAERPVVWRNPSEPLDFFKDLPSALATVVRDADAQVVEASEYAEAVLALVAEEPDQAAPRKPEPEAAELPDATEELAKRLYMPDTRWLQDCVELLRAKPQLIFQGPPGTGKTFAALELARHLTGNNPTNFRLVQFHPAYSYEDFFEGIRPRLGGTGGGKGSGTASGGRGGKQTDSQDGQLGFTMARGPLRKLADDALERPSEVFVLVIDEINRGNLAKIFGELYFLLEYREERAHLLYGSDGGHGFMLPPNVYIIGTMNTVDRSVAFMDAAMRRRFSFMELHPDTPPAKGLLSTWLKDNDFPQTTAMLLDEINNRIAESSPSDRSFRVGHSYFMQELAHSGPGALERLWRTQILPLLTEYHWGDNTDVDLVYGLDTLRTHLGIPGEPDEPEETEAEPATAEGTGAV